MKARRTAICILGRRCAIVRWAVVVAWGWVALAGSPPVAYGRLSLPAGSAKATPESASFSPLELRPAQVHRSWREVIADKLPSVDTDFADDARQPPFRLPQEHIAKLEYRYPLDSGRQWRTTLEFSLNYLPENYPEKTLDDFSYDDYVNSEWLEQRGWANPFRIAAEEVRTLGEDEDRRLVRALLAAAYLWRNRRDKDVGRDTFEAILGRERYLIQELMVDLVLPKIVELLPGMLTEVSSGPGQVPVDLRVASSTSFDSATSLEHLLLRAGQRGLKAVVIADRNRIDGAQRAQAVAQRLRSAGKLPTDFRVIVGEYIDTLSGGVLALFVKWRIPAQMTMKATLEMIHKQSALAIMAHPGVVGGPRLLEQMPFDGYLIQSGLFEMFRTLQLLYRPSLADKPGLYGSNSLWGAGVGLPYTIIEADDTSAATLKQAFAEGRVYPAGGMYLPWMMAAAMKPIGQFESTINRFFVWHNGIEGWCEDLIGADTFRMRTTWDRELQSWMGLDRLAEGVARIGNRTSPLLEFPHLTEVAAEYSCFQLMYQRPESRFTLKARYIW